MPPTETSAPSPPAAPSPMNAAEPAWHALRVAFWRKPLHLVASHSDGALPPDGNALQDGVESEANGREMERTLGLFDLIMLGIGGTVGSGVFATAGLIASAYAGPAATLSWLLAGVGCLLSGLSFMELACLIPSAGSTYAYAYHALGELPAMLAGFLLTLEYGVSSAGGARSWSDKFTGWMDAQLGVQGPEWMKPADSTVDLYAGLLMAANVTVVLCGMQAGKLVVNLVTMTKISVVSFIIVVGLLNFDAANITPFIPEQTVVVEEGGNTQSVAFGWPGVLLGASASFYGYIGYDEVCCLAGEAKDPARNIPRAVVGTILGAATLSILATFALVGMQRYTEIDAGESYGNAFSSVGMDWAASFVVTGEVLTMPITSFIGFLAQPRVQYAMAKDGLLPAVFAKVDANGNLFHGTLICGVAVTILAVFVPFHVLWNFISLGILVAFNLTNSSLLFVRASSGSNRSEGEQQATNDGAMRSQGWLIAGYLVTSFLAAFHWQKSVVASAPLSSTSLFDRYMQTAGPIVAAVFTLLAIGLMFALSEAEKKQTVHSSPATTKTKTRAQDGPVEIVLASKKEEQAMAGRVGCLQRRRSADRGDDELHTPEGEDDEVERHEALSESTSRLENGRRTATDSDEEDEPDSAKGEEEADAESSTFRAPFVPFAPCIAIFFNWFLFAQMDGGSVLLILLWLLLALAVYFGYSRHHSLAYQQTRYHQLAQH